MSNATADVEAYLESRRKRTHYYTRTELDWLDKVATSKATTKQAASAIGVSVNTVNTWLRKLGHRRRQTYTRERRLKVIPWESPLRCQRCGILLQYADYHRDGLCDWCIEQTPAKYETLQDAINGLQEALDIHEEAVQAAEGRG
jgi:hypothetical protein